MSVTACARDAPPPERGFNRGHRRAIIATIALLLCALFSGSAPAQEPISEPMRLRIAWGGGDASAWVGRISLSNGSLSELRLLSRAADSAGSIWLEGGQVRVKSLSAHNQDALQLDANAGQSSQLFVELSPDASKPASPIAVPLADVLRRPFEIRLDDRGNTLKVEHVPADPLRIVLDRDTHIFAPGEQFSFELHPTLPDMAPGTTLDIHTTLSPARRKETIWSDPQRLNVPFDGAPVLTMNVSLPRAEGAYTVRVSAERPPGFRPRFFPGGAAPLAERAFDVVVLDARPQQAAANASWQTVLEIDPTNPRWWERLPTWTQVRRIPGVNFGQLGSIRAATVERPLGRFIELPPTVADADPHWQAYSLPLEALGTPHLLEIEYPADEEQHFGISIVEPNATGVTDGIGRDGGVYVEGFGRERATQTHRTMFWPRTQAPLLLVTNQHLTAAAHFGHIRVLKRSNPQLTTAPAVRSPSDRLVAAYIARPLLAESFGASQGLSKPGRPNVIGANAVDDWQTFYESATRLSEFARYGGYNSAVVNVLADDSAIYPSSHLPVTPLYNSGRGASDAPQRDGLELLFRIFDRDGLALVPALQLAAPLPALEELRRTNNPQTSGLEWVGPNGKTWLEVNGAQQGLAPYYNLLEPRVQQAVLQVVQELVDRYGKHTAFAGLAIQLSANGYGQLPPLDWGLDDATIARFERDTGIALAADGPNRFAARHALVTRDHAEAWRAWRTERVAAFYSKIAALLRQSGTKHGDRRLILTLEESFDHPHLASRVRPNILLANRVDAALLDSGIDRQRLEKTPGIVVCATRYVESMAPLAERAIDFELNEAFDAWQRPAESKGEAAALLYHRPERRRLTSFRADSLKIAGGIDIISQPSAQGSAVRQPYVRTLLQHDPVLVLDGGELLPLGQDDSLRKLREITRQLPTTADVAEVSKQPITVRMYSEPNRVTLLVVNASPWPANADVTLQSPQAATMTPLVDHSDARAASPTLRSLAAGQQPWPLALEPYAIQAVQIDAPGVQVIDVKAESDEAAKAELKARLTDLENRDPTAPRSYSALRNPSFEPLGGAGPPSGWRITTKSAAVELDATNPQDGTTCVYFRNDGQLAALESEPFPIPPTGQLAMTVYVRDQKIASGELRMVIEAIHEGHVYRRSAIVAPPAPGPASASSPWQYKAILVNDLPLELRGEMRVRFELTGPGEVWLDGVQLYDLLFPLKFYKYDEAEILQFVQLTHAAKNAYEEGRVVDCARLLDRYWPRFLTEYTPLIRPVNIVQPAANEQQPLPAQANQNQEPAPGIGERIKSIFPFVR
ncbi:MAG: hypothetical protein L0228_08380 [Planctomycetes bacterium]|nr:hypothetical protein [Planctomycetota bacterium]